MTLPNRDLEDIRKQLQSIEEDIDQALTDAKFTPKERERFYDLISNDEMPYCFAQVIKERNMDNA